MLLLLSWFRHTLGTTGLQRPCKVNSVTLWWNIYRIKQGMGARDFTESPLYLHLALYRDLTTIAFFFILKDMFNDFRERGRQREQEGDIRNSYQLPLVSTLDPGPNPQYPCGRTTFWFKGQHSSQQSQPARATKAAFFQRFIVNTSLSL